VVSMRHGRLKFSVFSFSHWKSSVLAPRSAYPELALIITSFPSVSSVISVESDHRTSTRQRAARTARTVPGCVSSPIDQDLEGCSNRSEASMSLTLLDRSRWMAFASRGHRPATARPRLRSYVHAARDGCHPHSPARRVSVE
jgi:hypothetical protein